MNLEHQFIKLGDVTLKSKVLLAPMAGVTDLPYRKMVRKFGEFLMYSEMAASQAVIRNVRKTFKIMDISDDKLTLTNAIDSVWFEIFQKVLEQVENFKKCKESS